MTIAYVLGIGFSIVTAIGIFVSLELDRVEKEKRYWIDEYLSLSQDYKDLLELSLKALDRLSNKSK